MPTFNFLDSKFECDYCHEYTEVFLIPFIIDRGNTLQHHPADYHRRCCASCWESSLQYDCKFELCNECGIVMFPMDQFILEGVRGSNTTFEGKPYCNTCFEEVKPVVCKICGETIDRQYSREENYDYYCESCWKQHKTEKPQSKIIVHEFAPLPKPKYMQKKEAVKPKPCRQRRVKRNATILYQPPDAAKYDSFWYYCPVCRTTLTGNPKEPEPDHDCCDDNMVCVPVSIRTVDVPTTGKPLKRAVTSRNVIQGKFK